MSKDLVKDYSQEGSIKSNLTVGSSMLNEDFDQAESADGSPLNTAQPLTDSLKYEGQNEVDARPVLTGGIIRTGTSETRLQLSQISPDAPNFQGGEQDPALYVLQEGGVRMYLNANSLNFFTPIGSPSGGAASGSIYGFGTNLLVIDVGDEQYNFDVDFYPTSDGMANLGRPGNVWKAVYATDFFGDVSGGDIAADEFTVNGVKILSDTGDPDGSVTAPKGSLYLRQDGSSTTSRIYVNKDGSTSWTPVICFT